MEMLNLAVFSKSLIQNILIFVLEFSEKKGNVFLKLGYYSNWLLTK